MVLSERARWREARRVVRGVLRDDLALEAAAAVFPAALAKPFAFLWLEVPPHASTENMPTWSYRAPCAQRSPRTRQAATSR